MAGGFVKGEIKLDTKPIYYSGQVVSGSIDFSLDIPISFSVIYIQFIGEATVSWNESEIETVNGVENHKIINYVGREEYFNQKVTLAGGTGVSQLSAGPQSYAFKYQLPFNAPSSLKREHGKVTYTMKAHLVHADPSILVDELVKDFEVVAPFDLNLGSPRVKQPTELEFEEVYGCDCFCSTNPVTIRVKLPVSGYCPGQVIPIAIEVVNKSSVEITKMIFQIVSKELYRSHRPPSEYILPETVLSTTKKGPVMARSKRNLTCDLVVPEIIPPYLENCGIIDVGYFFRVTIKLSGCNDELQDEAEICLGLVPVREFTEEYVHPLAHNLPVGPIPDASQAPPHLLLPPVTIGFRGSNTSLNRVQVAPSQLSPYQNNPPPYPGLNNSYPGSRSTSPVSMEMKPKVEIGFTVPAGANTGYPGAGSGYPGSGSGYPGAGPGYPTNPPVGGYPPSYAASVQPPYPTGNMPSSGPPYSQGGFAPSAPPPSV
ncbi:unnamed protein product [Spodoptera exigua]|nr:unnamed protein product [Spodoptera exigua]